MVLNTLTATIGRIASSSAATTLVEAHASQIVADVDGTGISGVADGAAAGVGFAAAGVKDWALTER